MAPSCPIEAFRGMPHVLHRIFVLGIDHGDFQRCRVVSKEWKQELDKLEEEKVSVNLTLAVLLASMPFTYYFLVSYFSATGLSTVLSCNGSTLTSQSFQQT